MRGTKVIPKGSFMKVTTRYKLFKLFFTYMVEHMDGVTSKQLCNDLNIGRNMVIRFIKQATIEEMITRTNIDGTNINLIKLTHKGINWISD